MIIARNSVSATLSPLDNDVDQPARLEHADDRVEHLNRAHPQVVVLPPVITKLGLLDPRVVSAARRLERRAGGRRPPRRGRQQGAVFIAETPQPAQEAARALDAGAG